MADNSESNIDVWAGRRVRLRARRADDWKAFHQDAADGEAARLGNEIELPMSEDAWRARIEKPWDAAADKVWLVIEALTPVEIVGSINVHETNKRHGDFEYGISIFRPHWRKGYASEAIALLLRHYFRELGYHRATATVYAFNHASIALHRGFGFTEEGRLRESLFTNGRYFDEYLFGILASEFEPIERRLLAPA